MWDELAVKTPTLLTILEAVFSCKATGLSKIWPVTCIVVAIMAKFMNPAVNLVQSYISILLHAGHCSKQVCFQSCYYTNNGFMSKIIQVFCRLQKLMICMSSESTLKLLESMGYGHDVSVFEWRDHLHHRLEQNIPEVRSQ